MVPMKLSPVFVLVLGCLGAAGCMHTVISGNATPSPDGEYKLWMAKHGAGGKAYTARTKKRVYLWIDSAKTNRAPSFSKKYVFTAADLEADDCWTDSTGLTITFYDYGDGVLASEARKTGVPSNHVATLRFVRDPRTGGFIEKK